MPRNGYQIGQQPRLRKHDANRIVEQMVMDAAHLTADVNLIDFAQVDRARVAEWVASFRVSKKNLGDFIARLSKLDADGARPTGPGRGTRPAASRARLEQRNKLLALMVWANRTSPGSSGWVTDGKSSRRLEFVPAKTIDDAINDVVAHLARKATTNHLRSVADMEAQGVRIAPGIDRALLYDTVRLAWKKYGQLARQNKL